MTVGFWLGTKELRGQWNNIFRIPKRVKNKQQKIPLTLEVKYLSEMKVKGRVLWIWKIETINYQQTPKM